MGEKMEVMEVQRGVVLRTIEDLKEVSKYFAASGLMPKGLEKPEAVFVAIQMGLEIGLGPMQAVQNVAVINGRPSVWGDAALALIQGSGYLEDFDEQITGSIKGNDLKATCTARRKGRPKPVVREFSLEDAKLAGLFGKTGPWSQYPKRMMQMRARSWALRDLFPDVLKGVRIAEEAQDMPVDAEWEPAEPVSTEALAEPVISEDDLLEDLTTAVRDVLKEDVEQAAVKEYAELCAENAGATMTKLLEQALANVDGFASSFLAHRTKAAKDEQGDGELPLKGKKEK